MSRPETTFLSEHLEREKDYWLRKLAGAAPPAGLPLDFPRPPVFSERTESVDVPLDGGTVEKLFRAAGSNHSLAFAVLVAALKLCLRRYTGEEDIAVGTVIHGQHAEDAVLNRVLVLRDRVSGVATTRQLLDAVKQTLAEAYAHSERGADAQACRARAREITRVED